MQFSAVPWLHGYLSGLVRELLQSAELRLDSPRKLRLPSTAEIKPVREALRRGDLIAIVTSHAERATLDRVQAVMAVIEGHAEHVMDAVAPDLLPNLPKLREAIDRRRRSQSGLSRLLGKLLGMDMKMRQYEQGKIFCDAVVRERGVAALPTTSSPGPRRSPAWRRSATRGRGWRERLRMSSRGPAATRNPSLPRRDGGRPGRENVNNVFPTFGRLGERQTTDGVVFRIVIRKLGV